MAGPDLTLQGMAYVPGWASGELQRGTSVPGLIALVDLAQALQPQTTPAAFIVVGGAPLSHSMIALVARGVPTVVIDSAQEALLTPGSRVSVDGASGRISVGGQNHWMPPPSPQPPTAGQPVRLADATPVWLMASVRNREQARQAQANGASSIGLVRTEFLASDHQQPPTAACLTREFETLCQAAGGLALTMRLIDIAADKPPRWLEPKQHLLHPLGMQGSRLFHHEPIRSVLEAQLTALQAVSHRYPIEVLIPFIGKRDELSHWLETVRRTLPNQVPVGAMAETPAAVLELANWGDLVDFFSIGTNDLIQYFFAADRDEPALGPMLDPYDPAIFRLLEQVATTAGGHLKRIRLCGVLPRLSGVLPVLVGLGFRRFSVDPTWIPYLAASIYGLTSDQARLLSKRICECRDSKEVVDTLQQA